MRFVLVDRITELHPGQSLVATKNLSLAEEYLADHFPGFPVMPGVLMLEALTQAGAWLVRDMEDFAKSVVVLKKAKMIKYGSFVEPGRQLQLKVTLVSHDEHDASFKGEGTIDGQVMVKGQFTLTRFNLRDRDPGLHSTDASIVAGLRDLYSTLRKGSVGARAILREAAVPGQDVAVAEPSSA
jgi:3-hydroxyacyl-[acyl-carrier-protein] dehydratase